MSAHRKFDVQVRASAMHVNAGDKHRHQIVLAYDKDDPLVAEIVFLPELESWRMGRDLLVTAAIQGAPAGEGDVFAQPVFSAEYGAHLYLVLRGKDDAGIMGEEQFVLDRRTVQKFLYATMDLVALGEEDYSAQVDKALEMMRA